MNSQSDPSPLRDEVIDQVRREFRKQLESFYAGLKLAPPYDSVEKAIGQLTLSLKRLDSNAMDRLTHDVEARRSLFREAFVLSGLNLKHRGIILGLRKSPVGRELSPDVQHLLDAF